MDGNRADGFEICKSRSTQDDATVSAPECWSIKAAVATPIAGYSIASAHLAILLMTSFGIAAGRKTIWTLRPRIQDKSDNCEDP